MRIAAIDIGTNSVHMVIARALGPRGFEVVDREREVVQVGRGSFATRRIQARAIQRTVDCLVRFVRLARRHQVDRILCTATAAVREARNGGDFVAAARAATGVMPRVIPAEEEGRLIYLGVRSALDLEPAKPSLIVDIGGGSVQLVVANRDRVLEVASVPLGALRLTECILAHDPPTRRDLGRLERQVKKGLRKALVAVAAHEPVLVLGSSGAIHALAHIVHWNETGQAIGQINGHVLERSGLERLTKRLRKMGLAERESLPGIDLMRAEILLPGAVVLLRVLEGLGAESITMSDFGVREGLVTDWIARHPQEITSLEAVEDLRLRSVLQLARKFQTNEVHAQHVRTLALALFDGLARRHGLEAAERDLLEFAALLHDIGAGIDYDRHAEHSAYIIRHGKLRGLKSAEVEIVSNVARFHSKQRPRKREPGYAALDKRSRRTVRWLAAILRVAEGLDRSHYQLIEGLAIGRSGAGFAIRVAARRDAQLELWAARRRVEPLAKMLDAPVRIALARAGAKTLRRVAATPGARATEAKAHPPAVKAPVTPVTRGAPAAPRSAIVSLAGRRRA